MGADVVFSILKLLAGSTVVERWQGHPGLSMSSPSSAGICPEVVVRVRLPTSFLVLKELY